MVAKKFIMKIIPRFDLPIFLGSNNGLPFMAKLSRLLSKALDVNWKLCCMYYPQRMYTGKVERMNSTLKGILTKYPLQTGGNWVDLLP